MDSLFAGLAVIVAALAALLAWRQQNRINETQQQIAALQNDYVEVMKRLAEVEDARRSDELSPVLELSFGRPRVAGRHQPRFVLKNSGPLDYDRIEFEVRTRPSVIRGIGVGPGPVDAMSFGPLVLGDAVEIPAFEDVNGQGGEVRAWATCSTADRGSWRVLVTCKVKGYASAW